MQPASPRQQLLEAIAQLSDRQLAIGRRFIQTLPPKPLPTPASTDPLIDLIGATHHGKLAQARSMKPSMTSAVLIDTWGCSSRYGIRAHPLKNIHP